MACATGGGLGKVLSHCLFEPLDVSEWGVRRCLARPGNCGNSHNPGVA